MKKISFNKTYRPFLITGWIALFMALFFKIFYPESNFDVSIYSTDFFMAYSVVWLSFSGYLFLLAAIYFYINKAGLKTKKWLVNSHYMFIVLFLFFFIVFSAFGNADVKKLTAPWV